MSRFEIGGWKMVKVEGLPSIPGLVNTSGRIWPEAPLPNCDHVTYVYTENLTIATKIAKSKQATLRLECVRNENNRSSPKKNLVPHEQAGEIDLPILVGLWVSPFTACWSWRKRSTEKVVALGLVPSDCSNRYRRVSCIVSWRIEERRRGKERFLHMIC